jgi:hypothetical protein
VRRRRLLAAVGGLGALGLAGGATLAARQSTRGDPPSAPAPATDRRPAGDRAPAGPPIPRDVRLPLPESAFERGTARDAIPAIVEPAFAPDWAGLAVPVDDQFGRRTARPRLGDGDAVIGVRVGDGGIDPGPEADDDHRPVARAYPLRVLVHHEVVNDVVADRPLAVTYCPLCASGLVADRRVPTDGAAPPAGGSTPVTATVDQSDTGTATNDGAGPGTAIADGAGARRSTTGAAPARFGVSGLLWRDNLVLYDAATGSLWSQLLARAVRGPLTGTPLEPLPSTLTTWGQWRADHPGTDVLLPPPHSGTIAPMDVPRDYRLNPYAAYGDNRAVGFGEGGFASQGTPAPFDDDRLHPKTQVLGVAHGGTARAYPYATVAGRDGPDGRAGLVHDRVGDLPVIVAAVADGLVAYDRRIDGRARRFVPVDGHERSGEGPGVDRHAGGPEGPTTVRTARAAGSRWRLADGVAIDGPRRGTRLAPATRQTTQFWFAWLSLYPESSVYGIDG